MKQHEQLRRYNRWRRGDKRLKSPDPKALGELLDGVADRLEVLEREHAEFLARWHAERLQRERLASAIAAMLGVERRTGLDLILHIPRDERLPDDFRKLDRLVDEVVARMAGET